MSSRLQVTTDRDDFARTMDLKLHLKLPFEDLAKMPSVLRENIVQVFRDPTLSNATMLHRLADFITAMDGKNDHVADRKVEGAALTGGRALDLG